MREPNQIDTIVRVVTPENIAFEYQVAGPFLRGAALMLDLFIRIALFVAVVYLFTFLSIVARSPGFFGIILIWWFLLDWFYGGFCEAYMNGQTPGKRAYRLRVLTIDGQPINGAQAVLRNILRYVDVMPLVSLQVFGAMFNESIPPMYMIPTSLLGLLAMASNPRMQRCGDIVCGTMVIQEQRQVLNAIGSFEDTRVPQLAEFIPVDFRATRSLAQTLAMYVERRRLISPPRRSEIAKHLATPLMKRFQFPPDTSADVLLCALHYRTFVASHGDTVFDTVGTTRPAYVDPAYVNPTYVNTISQQPLHRS